MIPHSSFQFYDGDLLAERDSSKRKKPAGLMNCFIALHRNRVPSCRNPFQSRARPISKTCQVITQAGRIMSISDFAGRKDRCHGAWEGKKLMKRLANGAQFIGLRSGRLSVITSLTVMEKRIAF